MKQFFEKRDRWGNGLSLWVILGCIFVSPMCVWLLKQTRIENDIEHWLPSDDPNAITLKWSMEQFGLDGGDNVLVSWDDSSLLDPRIEKLAQRLEGKPDENGKRRGGVRQVARVVTPKDVIVRMVDHGVDRDEAIQRLRGVLVGTGPFKVRLTEQGRLRQKEVIRELKSKAKRELGVELKILPAIRDYEPLDDEPAVEESAEQASTSVAATDSSAKESVPPPSDLPTVEFDPIPVHDFQIRWPGMLNSADAPKLRELALSLKGGPTADAPDGAMLVEDCFHAVGSPVAITVAMSESGSAEKANTISLIREAAIAVGVPETQLHLGGRPVGATALNEGVKTAVWNPDVPITHFHKRSVIIMSGLVGVAMAFLMLRSVKLSVLVLLVSYFTVFVTLAVVNLTGASMNMVMILMPTFLLVVVMSGAIHVAHYWRHEAYHNLSTAVTKAAALAGPPCAFATVTTAIGLLSLATSDLKPIRDFGIYSAVGSVIGLGAVLYLLPSLIQWIPFQPPKPSEVDSSKWEAFGRWCARKRHWIVWGYTGVSLVCLIGLQWFRTETKVIRFFPADSRIVQDYWFLEENLAGIIPVDVIVRFDRASQSQLPFLDRMEIVRTIENRMREHPEISGAIALPDFRPVTEKPAEDAGFLQKGGYIRKSNEIERRIKDGEVSGAKSFFAVAKQSHDLHRPGDAELNQADDELWRITAQVNIMSDANFGELMKEVHGIAQSVLRFNAGTHHVVTGMVPLFLETQQALLNSQITSFGAAYLTVSIVMIFAVRHLLAGMITMLPNVYPIGQIFGLISFFNVPVDMGTMMTASIAMGLGVDGTLHKLTWFRRGIMEGRSREDSIALALGHSGPAIWETSAVLAAGMMMLFPADLLLVCRFGWLMAAIIGVAVAGDVLFLPALLGGSLGTMIIKQCRSEQAKHSPSSIPHPHIGAAHTSTANPSHTLES